MTKAYHAAILVVAVVAISVATWWQASIPSGAGLPDMPQPSASPDKLGVIVTDRLEIMGPSGKPAMVFFCENGISYVIIDDGGKQRKIDLVKLARRL